MNEILKTRNWWQTNWKWFIPTLGFLLFLVGLIFTTDIDENISNITKAYADSQLVENAMIKSLKNQEVQQLLGSLNPIDQMAIAEGRVKYSNNNNTVDMSVRVKGDKGKGRIRIIAERIGGDWEYKKISIGIKKPSKTILITQ